MYSEVTTKDGNLGLIVVAEKVQQVLEEMLDWLKEHNLEAKDLNPITLIDASSKETVGTISYDGKQVICTPV